ncbi:hypothetical protein AB1Y20_011823 [Prymnesium parvum]|uniref:Uncharacterized protein n=1 Tax=Prymnesium parvum TaxID=97485 RepID=A0AB34IHM2_PRYPA
MAPSQAAALAELAARRAAENGWVIPGKETPQQTAAAKKIQAWARGWLARRHRRKGVAGKVDAAIAQAEIQLIKHPLLGFLCNLTTRWGCSWSNRHRQSLLVIAAILVLTAFVVQKLSFLGLWLDPAIMSFAPWVLYEVDPQVVAALIYLERNASDADASALANQTAYQLVVNGSLIPTKGNIWGQCAWLSGDAEWRRDDGSSRCWTWSALESLMLGAGEGAAEVSNTTVAELAAVGNAFKDCDDAGDQLIPAVCIGLIFSIFPIGDSFSRWTLAKDSGHAKCIGMLISAIVMTIDALNFFRYHNACLIKIEDASRYFHKAHHGFGFVCLYTAWLLTGIAFAIKAFIPGSDLRDSDKAAYYRAELERRFQANNPFKAAIKKHQQIQMEAADVEVGGPQGTAKMKAVPANDLNLQDI